jgi:hypothetical protein
MRSLSSLCVKSMVFPPSTLSFKKGLYCSLTYSMNTSGFSSIAIMKACTFFR